MSCSTSDTSPQDLFIMTLDSRQSWVSWIIKSDAIFKPGKRKLYKYSLYDNAFQIINLPSTLIKMKLWCWWMVFCLQNCSDLQWEKIVLVNEKNFWKKFEISRTIFSNSEKSVRFLKQNSFLNFRLLRSNTLEKIGCRLEKKIGI